MYECLLKIPLRENHKDIPTSAVSVVSVTVSPTQILVEARSATSPSQSLQIQVSGPESLQKFHQAF